MREWLTRLAGREPEPVPEPAWTRNTDPRTHDWTSGHYTGWGHALHGFEATEDPEVMAGSCHSMHPIAPGDLMVWDTSYGTATGRIEEMRWVQGVDDMYNLDVVRILSRRILTMPDRPVGTVLPLPPGIVAFEAPGWEPADPDYRTVVRVS